MKDTDKLVGFLYDDVDCSKAFVDFATLECEKRPPRVRCVSYALDENIGDPAANVKLVAETCDVICVVLASANIVHEEKRCAPINDGLDGQAKKRTIVVVEEMHAKNPATNAASFGQLNRKQDLLHLVKCPLRSFPTWSEKKKVQLANEVLARALTQ